MDRVWNLSQDADLHRWWDCRFSRNVSLHPGEEDGSIYAFPCMPNTGPGRRWDTGISRMGKPLRRSASTWSIRCPVGRGSGCWCYFPAEDGLRFITGYNYRPGLGRRKDPGFQRDSPSTGMGRCLDFCPPPALGRIGVEPQTGRDRWFLDAGAGARGLLAAGFVLRRTLTTSNPGVALAGVAAAPSSFTIRFHGTIPRSRRCLPCVPDARSARVPSAFAGLKTSEERESAAHR